MSVHTNRIFQANKIQLAVEQVEMKQYYDQKSLNPNTLDPQVSAFHLRNREVNCKHKKFWRGKELEHQRFTAYLGSMLDRRLWFTNHLQKLQKNVVIHNVSL